MAHEVLDVRWFSGRDCIGVVRVYDQYEGVKYYIGVAVGLDEETAIEHIAAWGSVFSNHIGDNLFEIEEV